MSTYSVHGPTRLRERWECESKTVFHWVQVCGSDERRSQFSQRHISVDSSFLCLAHNRIRRTNREQLLSRHSSVFSHLLFFHSVVLCKERPDSYKYGVRFKYFNIICASFFFIFLLRLALSDIAICRTLEVARTLTLQACITKSPHTSKWTLWPQVCGNFGFVPLVLAFFLNLFVFFYAFPLSPGGVSCALHELVSIIKSKVNGSASAS